MKDDEDIKKIKENKIKKYIKGLPKIIKWIIIVIIFVVVFFSGILFKSVLTNQVKTTKLGFEDVGELITQKCNLSIIGDIKDYRKLFNMKIPFTESRQIFSYDISVDASIDFTKIKQKRNDEKKEIIVKIPHAKIYSATIDDESLKVYIDDESLFSRIDLKEHNDERIRLREQGIEDAKANGLLRLAEENAEKLIKGFIRQDNFYKDYNILFEYQEGE